MALFVGTYAHAGGAGLYPLHQGDSGWILGEPYGAAANASFGVWSERFGLRYLVDEREDGMLRVLRQEGPEWKPLARVPTRGALPCYAGLSTDEAWLAIANYGSGSLALFRLDPETGLPGNAELHSSKGHGPDRERQTGPHAHCAIFSPDGTWLYQTDLGADRVLAFPFEAARGVGTPQTAFAAPAGSGPRHLVFQPHRPLAFLISELASSLTVLDVGDGTLEPRQSVSTLPGGCQSESLGGHLGINAAGDRVYVTNRGHDSVATYAFDEASGLALLGHVPSGGASP
ncbi:MAG: lactonase family protein, partial [Sphingomonadales bacterium]